jgi:hypothetical protein
MASAVTGIASALVADEPSTAVSVVSAAAGGAPSATVAADAIGAAAATAKPAPSEVSARRRALPGIRPAVLD